MYYNVWCRIMEELINQLKEIANLSELENVNGINPNALIYAIAKSERYELLNLSGEFPLNKVNKVCVPILTNSKYSIKCPAESF